MFYTSQLFKTNVWQLFYKFEVKRFNLRMQVRRIWNGEVQYPTVYDNEDYVSLWPLSSCFCFAQITDRCDNGLTLTNFNHFYKRTQLHWFENSHLNFNFSQNTLINVFEENLLQCKLIFILPYLVFLFFLIKNCIRFSNKI